MADEDGKKLSDWVLRLVTAFQLRSPWAAALLAVLGPVPAMLFLGKGRLAIFYFFLPFSASAS